MFFLVALALSCVGMEKTIPAKQEASVSAEAQEAEDSVKVAYQNYILASIALLNGDFEEAEGYLGEALKWDEDSPYLLLKLIQVLVGNGKTQEALSLAEKAVALTPDDVTARGMLAGIYSRLSRFDPAISQYREILAKNPKNKEARLNLSTVYIRLKKYDDALKELSILIRNEPDLIMAHYYKGRVNLELRNYGEAEEAFLKVLEFNPRFLPALFDVAALYSATGNDGEAIETHKKIVFLYPANTAARERLITLYYKVGFEELAEKHIDELKRILNPGDLKRKRLGLIYLKHGKLDESIAEFTSIVSAWPNDPEARYYLGAALEEKGDSERAYEHFALLAPDSSFFITARIHMAYILERQEKVDKAIELMREAIVQASDHPPELYSVLSSLHEIKKEYPNAMGILKEGLEYNEKNTELRYRLGVILGKLKRTKESIEQMEIVIGLNPEHADALNYIGYSYADEGIHLDKALELIERALKHKPDSGYIIDSLGWVYFRKGHYERALVELEKAVELTPEDPAINEHLGDVYFQKRDYKKALEIYRKAHSLKNADRERLERKIKDAMERLKGDAP